MDANEKKLAGVFEVLERKRIVVRNDDGKQPYFSIPDDKKEEFTEIMRFFIMGHNR